MIQQTFNGIKFTKDKKSGYYLNSTLRIRMHRYVWEYYNGKIPSGYEIHHKDCNKDNNSIENLQLLTAAEHDKIHACNMTSERKHQLRENFLKNALPKATEWHKSEKGHEWHKNHYEKYCAEKFHKKYNYTCAVCKKEFVGEKGSKFCSNACKSKYRRNEKKDLKKFVCKCCGKEFYANKYKNQITCSRSCANKYRRIKNESCQSKEAK